MPKNALIFGPNGTDSAGKLLRELDAKTVVFSRKFAVGSALYFSVQVGITASTGSGTHSIWTLEVSNDGESWFNPPAGTLTYTAPFISAPFDVSSYGWVRVRLSTVTTYTTETVNITVVASDGQPGTAGATGSQGPTGATGSTGATGAAGITTYARASDLTMSASSTTSLGLSFAYTAGDTLMAKYILFINTTAGVSGLNFDLGTLPTGVVGRLSVSGPTSGLTSFGEQSSSNLTSPTTVNLFTVSASGIAVIDLLVRGGSGSGTIDLQLVTGLLQAGTVYQESNVLVGRV